MSAELSSIRKYKKENEWGTKKFAERDAIFLTLDVLGPCMSMKKAINFI